MIEQLIHGAMQQSILTNMHGRPVSREMVINMTHRHNL